ncbi:hypothetical protein RRG08_016772 [Elysia crispata]|uniref:Uncharacterized protein n=1 Tax=Elysia crispata TaxID=231223 RepID=A0AAE0ZZR7_9GAST|nr:hypothetical protein RRG08_016772 [Elysia crispata]
MKNFTLNYEAARYSPSAIMCGIMDRRIPSKAAPPRSASLHTQTLFTLQIGTRGFCSPLERETSLAVRDVCISVTEPADSGVLLSAERSQPPGERDIHGCLNSGVERRFSTDRTTITSCSAAPRGAIRVTIGVVWLRVPSGQSVCSELKREDCATCVNREMMWLETRHFTP